MDQFKQISTFVDVISRGSLSAAARAEGIAPAMIGRRLDALEERLGVKLLQRTTRKIALTNEGAAFLESCQRILLDLENAETQVSERSARPSGHLNISAPAGFGRQHIAPLIPSFLTEYRDVSVTLNLNDRVVDLIDGIQDDRPDGGILSPELSLDAVLRRKTQRVERGGPAAIDVHLAQAVG